jgi:hypothetical protein
MGLKVRTLGPEDSPSRFIEGMWDEVSSADNAILLLRHGKCWTVSGPSIMASELAFVALMLQDAALNLSSEEP